MTSQETASVPEFTELNVTTFPPKPGFERAPYREYRLVTSQGMDELIRGRGLDVETAIQKAVETLPAYDPDGGPYGFALFDDKRVAAVIHGRSFEQVHAHVEPYHTVTRFDHSGAPIPDAPAPTETAVEASSSADTLSAAIAEYETALKRFCETDRAFDAYGDLIPDDTTPGALATMYKEQDRLLKEKRAAHEELIPFRQRLRYLAIAALRSGGLLGPPAGLRVENAIVWLAPGSHFGYIVDEDRETDPFENAELVIVDLFRVLTL